MSRAWLTRITSAPERTSSWTCPRPCFRRGFNLYWKYSSPEQIEAVAGHSAQNRVHHARGELAVRWSKEWPKQCHQEDEAATTEALRKVWAFQVKKATGRRRSGREAAFDPPVNGGAELELWFVCIQDCVVLMRFR